MTLDQMLTSIIKREGGFVDHPADKGGVTNHGVTQATLAEWRGTLVTASDVKALTENEARSIFAKRYFKDPGFDRLPGEELQAVLLDCAVNHGPRQAIRMLQAAIGVTEDGVLGSETLGAIPLTDNRRIALHVLAHRVRFYGRIISRDPSQAVFAAGWTNRAAELIESVA